MNTRSVSDTWERGNPYEQYVGRWSRRVAPLFLSWLDLPPGSRWADIGCGTGALSAAVLDHCSPSYLVGVEPSEGFLNLASQNLGGQAAFLLGSSAPLPLSDGEFDVIVSGLVLNFLPDLPAALSEMIRASKPGGTIAAYVWDYAGRMEIIKLFWDVAVSIDQDASKLHEGLRFPLCNPASLRSAFEIAGLGDVETEALDLRAEFVDFDDYWQPFLGGQGPAPAYVASLPEAKRATLRASLLSKLTSAQNLGFSLSARAWAVRAVKHGDVQKTGVRS